MTVWIALLVWRLRYGLDVPGFGSRWGRGWGGGIVLFCRLRLKCDGTRAETRFCLSAKRTSPFKSAGASVQSTTGSWGVRISGSNVGYTMFRGSEGYWLPTPFASFHFTSPPVRHRVPSRFNWTLQRPDRLLRPSRLLFIGYRSQFQSVKRPAQLVNFPPPCIALV